MTAPTVYQHAFAKINLSLSVGALRSDGMHPISSKMATIMLSDDLELTKLDAHSLSRYAIFWHEEAPKPTDIDWPVTNDLAVRAHLELQKLAGRTLPVQMKLQKRIPVGGGLGGGSADAAAMLRGTIELFNLDVDPSQIALELGSDVPFMIQGGVGEVSGIGEIITPLQFEEIHLVLIIPTYGCSTSEVFQAFDTKSVPEGASNDLLLPAFAVQEQLETDFNAMKKLTGLEIHLSGSGSTMFAICDNAQHARALAKKIEEQTEHVVIATKTCQETLEK